MITIVDIGSSNLNSIVNMVKKIGFRAEVSSDPEQILKADKIILPGVGSYNNGMKNLQKMGLIPTLNQKVLEKGTPILGICLGMQLLMEGSEEGSIPGLGWIQGKAVKFNFVSNSTQHKIPHMGWNLVSLKVDSSYLLAGLRASPRFYFVHSYHCLCNNPEDIVATSRYGLDFVCILNRDNIYGTQFHPEKSHRFGMRLLQNFLELNTTATSHQNQKVMRVTPTYKTSNEEASLTSNRTNRKTRIIPSLLLKHQGFVKTRKFKSPTYLGDPINIVKIFNDKEADELSILDITATQENRGPNFDLLKDIASECFMPLGYGGGLKSIEDIRKLFRLGFEKAICNTMAVENPSFLKAAADQFGNQSIVGSIDVKKSFLGRNEVYTRCGSKNTSLDPVDLARKMEQIGVGEIFLNSIDRDGTMTGYDIGLIKQLADAVQIPVVACGGAGKVEDFQDAVKRGGASAVAAGSFFVFQGKHRAVLINMPTMEELDQLSLP